MFRWTPFPFLRITPFFMLGIGVASWLNPYHAFISFIAVFTVYSGFTFFLTKPVFSRYHPWVGGLASIGLILLGSIRTHQQDASQKPDHLLHFTDTANYYVATVDDYPEPKANSYQVTLDMERMFVKNNVGEISSKGRVIIYQPKEDSSRLMQFGDRVLVKGIPNPVDSPKNPAEFDYRQFLAYQGIYHQQYLRATDWALLESNTLPAWLGLAGKWRDQCRDQLLRYTKDPQAQGIVLAIILGIKSHLEQDVRAAYAATGAMHVLAVSGLHVGIIYLVLNFLLWPIRQVPGVGNPLHAIVCVLILWLYAMLTGLSPSVLRAAVMFSFVIIGSTWRRQSNLYNTLACSAFVLLWCDPFMLYSVGFQLSYLAVFGIVYLQPRMEAWFTPHSKVANWIWRLTSVSIAAQIATFPLGMYYFHQFPIYFWLSNLVVIPAALAILPLGLVTLLTGFTVPALAGFFGFLLEQLIRLVNALVAMIQQLPGSTVERISITATQTWLLYVSMIFLILLFHYRTLRYLSLAVMALFVCVAIQAVRVYQQLQDISLTVYSVKEDTHLDFTQGFTNLHLGPWNKNALYHVLPNHIQKGLRTKFISDTTTHSLLPHYVSQEIEMVCWQSKTLALIRKPLDRQKPDQPISVDYVIIAHNAIRDLNDLNAHFTYEQLIIDGTNTKNLARKIAEEAAREHIAYHSVPLQGALTIPWKP